MISVRRLLLSALLGGLLMASVGGVGFGCYLLLTTLMFPVAEARR